MSKSVTCIDGESSFLCQKSTNNEHHHNQNNNNNNTTTLTGPSTSSSTRLQSSKMRDPNEPHIGKYRFVKVRINDSECKVLIFIGLFRRLEKEILLKLN